jgi:hypothetical protein
VSDTVRVFVNGIGLDAPTGGTALDAVALHGAGEADRVRSGALVVTDSRGLPVPPNMPLFNGAVLRLVPNRERDVSDPAARFDA